MEGTSRLALVLSREKRRGSVRIFSATWPEVGERVFFFGSKRAKVFFLSFFWGKEGAGGSKNARIFAPNQLKTEIEVESEKKKRANRKRAE